MYFDSLSALIEMGGHGPYVWSCYAAFLLVMALNGVMAFRQRRKILQQQARVLRRSEPVQDDQSQARPAQASDSVESNG